MLEANESPYTLGHLTDPIYGEVLTLPAVDGSRLGGLDILDEQLLGLRRTRTVEWGIRICLQ